VNPQTQVTHPVAYTLLAKPGRYTLKAKLLFPGWNAELMDWQGELETAPITIDLKPGSKAKPAK
jgi:hypothetical protein